MMVSLRSTLLVATYLVLTLTACRDADEPDAYGNVEATEVVVSAEASGRIESLNVVEGEELAAGTIVGAIEKTAVALEIRQAIALRDAAAAKIEEIAQQIDALEAQRRIAARTWERTRRLYEQRAATAHALDQAERELRVLAEQIEAAGAQTESVRKEVAALDAQIARIEQRLENAEIVNPRDGTVLATYARAGELTQIGQPLYRIANLAAMEVRAYITETQLASVHPGQTVQVTVDAGDDRHTIPGTVSRISSEAEFTPTPIQTREERADLVYAIEIIVPNTERILKIGMPADVTW